MELSSGDSRGEERKTKNKRSATWRRLLRGRGDFPRHRASILRTLPDDDEADAMREEEDPPVILKKDRLGLISRGANPAHALPEASFSPSGAPSSASGPLEATPRTKRLTSFKLGKRPVANATIDQ